MTGSSFLDWARVPVTGHLALSWCEAWGSAYGAHPYVVTRRRGAGGSFDVLRWVGRWQACGAADTLDDALALAQQHHAATHHAA